MSIYIANTAWVSGNAQVKGNARVQGALVYGIDIIEGDVTILSGWIKDVHWWRDVP